MMALMVPPFPAASRPSSTTITRSPLCTTQSCNRHNSLCNLRNSFVYSLRFISGLVPSCDCLDISRSQLEFLRRLLEPDLHRCLIRFACNCLHSKFAAYLFIQRAETGRGRT